MYKNKKEIDRSKILLDIILKPLEQWK